MPPFCCVHAYILYQPVHLVWHTIRYITVLLAVLSRMQILGGVGGGGRGEDGFNVR